MENSNSAPTGCYKCGRPGHWSHDCPDAPKSDHPNLNASFSGGLTGCYKCGRPGHWARDCLDAPKSDHQNLNASSFGGNFASKQLPRPEKPKKVPKSRTRPKLTPEILLSHDGIGYILRHFPRGFKYRGRGHEVSDLGNLIRLYREWHKHLLPYYSFDQFVHKADKVASSKRVKNCNSKLRDRVASGEDPTKLHENSDEDNGANDEQVNTKEASNSEGQTHNHQDRDHFDDIEENMLNEIYHKASEEPSHDIRTSMKAAEGHVTNSSGPIDQTPNHGSSRSSEVHITEEQRASMEANKLKAVERAPGGSSSEVQLTEEQRARMEANRLKALERAAAQARLLHSA